MGIEQDILELFSGLQRKVDFERWPDRIFLFRGETCFFRYNLNSGWLWCDRDRIWNKISEGKGFDYDQTQAFIKKLAEQHFKTKVVTPVYRAVSQDHGVEEHFKLKGVTPIRSIASSSSGTEQHFKLKEAELTHK